MIFVGIDVAKNKHDCFITNSDGEVLFHSFSITNNLSGFTELYQNILSVMDGVNKVKVGLEATGHYSYNLLGYLLDKGFPTYIINAGYFSIDKKGRMTNSKIKNKKEKTSDDIDAYDLIMKNKELLLDRDPKRSPVRFIFSHSALREGWDNPNVFQICTLKQSSSEVRKRQEVGRGLRLCVNQDGDRIK